MLLDIVVNLVIGSIIALIYVFSCRCCYNNGYLDGYDDCDFECKLYDRVAAIEQDNGFKYNE